MNGQVIETDPDIAVLISDLREENIKEFVTFMRERNKLIKEHGKSNAEAQLKTVNKAKINRAKERLLRKENNNLGNENGNPNNGNQGNNKK